MARVSASLAPQSHPTRARSGATSRTGQALEDASEAMGMCPGFRVVLCNRVERLKSSHPTLPLSCMWSLGSIWGRTAKASLQLRLGLSEPRPRPQRSWSWTDIKRRRRTS
jgi:hypothetical protein